jgi:hypothetical protein
MRVFENRMLRIFGPKEEEVVGGLRSLHNEELHNFHISPRIIRVIRSRRMRWVGCVSYMVERGNAYKVLVRKPEVKRPLGRHRRRWEANIRMDLMEIGWDGLSASGSGKDQWWILVYTVMDLWVP